MSSPCDVFLLLIGAEGESTRYDAILQQCQIARAQRNSQSFV